MDRFLYLVVGGVIVFLCGLWYLSGQEPTIYRDIIVEEIQGEPDTIRTFVDRIVYREREPELVVTEPEGAEDVVEDFCEPDTVEVVVQGDTVWMPRDTVYLLRSVVHDDSFLWWKRDNIRVFGPTSTGDLREVRYASYPGWSLRVGSESIFREPRLGFFKETIKFLIPLGAGYGLAKIIR